MEGAVTDVPRLVDEVKTGVASRPVTSYLTITAIAQRPLLAVIAIVAPISGALTVFVHTVMRTFDAVGSLLPCNVQPLVDKSEVTVPYADIISVAISPTSAVAGTVIDCDEPPLNVVVAIARKGMMYHLRRVNP